MCVCVFGFKGLGPLVEMRDFADFDFRCRAAGTDRGVVFAGVHGECARDVALSLRCNPRDS